MTPAKNLKSQPVRQTVKWNMPSDPSSLRLSSDQHIPISGVIVNAAKNNGKEKVPTPKNWNGSVPTWKKTSRHERLNVEKWKEQAE